MAYEKPGPQQPAHALMPAEKDAVLSFAGREDTVDYSLQLLAIKGAEANAFYLSASSVRLILQENGLGDDRTGRVRNSTRRNKPDRPDELTGPNQCWCWDVSYIKTDVLRVFWYLYVMLDEWSRKVVAWRISRYHNHEEAMGLIDDAIIAEGLLDIDKENLPVVVNDRGVQMKAKDVKQMFTDLGLTQTFSRPRTPNDNPFIESFFSSLKRAPVYPGRFSHLNEGVVMDFFGEYFRWYNTEHYHSRIGYVTPEQMHQDLAAGIIAERKRVLGKQQKLRKMYWSANQTTGSGL
jgi:transposase InsO family protein